MVKTIVFEHLNCLSDLKTASVIIFELRVKRLMYFYTSVRLVYFYTSIQIILKNDRWDCFEDADSDKKTRILY